MESEYVEQIMNENEHAEQIMSEILDKYIVKRRFVKSEFINKAKWDTIRKLRNSFMREMRKISFFKSQKKVSDLILNSVLNRLGKTLVVEFSRQAGKTECVTGTTSFLIPFVFALKREIGVDLPKEFNIGIFAPQKEQAKTDFDRIRSDLSKIRESGFNLQFSEFNGNTITIESDEQPTVRIFCFSASPTSRTESKTLHLIILEEAQDLEDQKVRTTILPMGAATNATVVYIGSGGYKKCDFWQHIQKLPNEDKVIVPYKEIIKERQIMYNITKNDFYLDYSKHIKKQKREIGEDSDEFKTQYGLEWMLERGQFITYEELMKLESEYDYEHYQKHGVGVELDTYAGIDWGKKNDSTILTVINQNCEVVFWAEFLGDDYSSQIFDIVQMLTRFRGLKEVFCDATGNQDMAVDMLNHEMDKKRMKAYVTPIVFTSKSKDMMYKNLKRLMCDKVMDGKIIEHARFKFPVEHSTCKEKFVKQMLDLQKEIRNNMWRCEAPSGPGYHDDYCDSIALACLAFKQVQEYKPVIA